MKPFFVKYNGEASDEQVNWGSNTDPRGLLNTENVYKVINVEVHSWHTKYYLEGIEGKFNSVHFIKAGRKKKISDEINRRTN